MRKSSHKKVSIKYCIVGGKEFAEGFKPSLLSSPSILKAKTIPYMKSSLLDWNIFFLFGELDSSLREECLQTDGEKEKEHIWPPSLSFQQQQQRLEKGAEKRGFGEKIFLGLSLFLLPYRYTPRFFSHAPTPFSSLNTFLSSLPDSALPARRRRRRQLQLPLPKEEWTRGRNNKQRYWAGGEDLVNPFWAPFFGQVPLQLFFPSQLSGKEALDPRLWANLTPPQKKILSSHIDLCAGDILSPAKYCIWLC